VELNQLRRNLILRGTCGCEREEIRGNEPLSWM